MSFARARLPSDPDRAGRRLAGQHATRPDVADLVCALCVRRPADRVLDPSCGDGVLLERAAARLAWLGSRSPRLAGVELDAAHAREASERLPRAVIVRGDFLDPGVRLGHGADGEFDAVVGNPPYVRQELIDPDRKRLLAARWGAASAARGAGRSDLHVHFWAPALDRLAAGGRLGFVVSAAWLDARYGEPLRRWLAGRFAVRLVVESDVESWFPHARVRTAIVVVEKRAPRPGEPARLVRLDRRLDQLVPAAPGCRERLAGFDDLARRLESGPGDAAAWRSRDEACASLAEGGWGARLRQPDLHFEILEKGRGSLVPLEEIATVRWGIKTGHDRVFFPPRGAVEPGLLRPAVFSLMDLTTLVVAPRAARRRLLCIDLRRRRDRALLSAPGSRAAAWLLRAEESGAGLRPTCRARQRAGRRWFELRPGPSGAILWSIMHQYRHLAPLNPAGLAANDNLLLVDPSPGIDARLLAALLNASPQALLKQGWGRRRNEGMLKTQACDLRAMPVADPRRLPDAARRALIGAFETLARREVADVVSECARADRRALDRLALQAMGVPGREAGEWAQRVARELASLHARERAWELDAVSARRRGARKGGPAGRGITPPAFPG
ncbi:MAG TPA: Eco57I restriction-modification methylase domain-containing protein [Candidatus Polarisedimenticolia bacterium]|nr:Eco57I restriction-modification methylase domain-containing protein [Candidatus Polarisedimenticolia bacterium]